MKFNHTLFLFFIVFNTFSQHSFSEKNAKELIHTFFEGFHKGDTLLMKSVMHQNMVLQTAFTNNENKETINETEASVFLKTIANRTKEQVWEEKVLDYKVQIDGNLAHIWTPYEFWYNGTFSHCGANAFTLVKTTMGWKILHLIDSRRQEGCF